MTLSDIEALARKFRIEKLADTIVVDEDGMEAVGTDQRRSRIEEILSEELGSPTSPPTNVTFWRTESCDAMIINEGVRLTTVVALRG